MAQEDKEGLLELLQAHGQNFLSSFGTSLSPQVSTESGRKKRNLDPDLEASDYGEQSSSDEDAEWTGFGNGNNVSESEESEADGGNEDEIEDDDFTSEAVSDPKAEVVVFSGPSASDQHQPRLTKAQAKAFMSSKISKFSTGVSESNPDKAEVEDATDEIERNNLKNDALLHKLVHTQILSGSLKSDINLTPAERRKALEGRVLELAGSAKLGHGETSARKEDRNRASKKVRVGLERKAEERREKSLEEAKNLGNFHHTIKHVFEGDIKGNDDKRRRDRGLKVGVGRFSGGVLKLSRSDVASVSRGGDSRRGSRGGPTRKRR